MPASLSTETTIANMALSLLGESGVSELQENTPQARVLRLHYEPVRDALLRSHRWNFARARAELSELSAAPAFGWENAFQLPADCLRLLELNGVQADSADADYEIEGDQLLTNAGEAKVIYIRRETDASKFDPLFVEALALKLAIAACLEITQSLTKRTQLVEQLEGLALPKAKGTDSNESRPPIHMPGDGSPTLSSRGGGYRSGRGGSSAQLVPVTEVGTDGEDGEDGWSPTIAIVSDGTRRVMQIVGWTGGQGATPETGYVGSTGIVSAVGDGVDIRGAPGSGEGDVAGPASATDSAFAAFDGITGKLLKDSAKSSASFEAAGAVTSHSAQISGVHGMTLFGASLVDDPNAETARSTLGLGTAATQASGDFLARATYDPAAIAGNVFDIKNHSGKAETATMTIDGGLL